MSFMSPITINPPFPILGRPAIDALAQLPRPLTQPLAGSRTITKPVTLRGIDVDGDGLVVKARTFIDGLTYTAAPGDLDGAWPLDVYPSGDLTIHNGFFQGPNGKFTSGTVMNSRKSSAGIGLIRELDGVAFVGFETDILRFYGFERFNRIYIGPQVFTGIGKPHYDGATAPELRGDAFWQNSLTDMTEAGAPGGGDNDWLRFAKASTSAVGKGTLYVIGHVVYRDDYITFLIQMALSGAYQPRLYLDWCWLPITMMGGLHKFEATKGYKPGPNDVAAAFAAGMKKLFHTSTPRGAVTWGRNMFDTFTGQPIPCPPGCVPG